MRFGVSIGNGETRGIAGEDGKRLQWVVVREVWHGIKLLVIFFCHMNFWAVKQPLNPARPAALTPPRWGVPYCAGSAKTDPNPTTLITSSDTVRHDRHLGSELLPTVL